MQPFPGLHEVLFWAFLRAMIAGLALLVIVWAASALLDWSAGMLRGHNTYKNGPNYVAAGDLWVNKHKSLLLAASSRLT